MNFKKIECKNYDIYFIKSKKFKTISISTIILNDFDISSITENNFMSEYLVTSTKKYNNEVLLSKEYMNLYDPRIDIYDNYKDVHAKCFDITFLNEKYTEDGMNKKTIDFYYSLMFDINETNGKLDEDISNMIKRRLNADYEINEENPAKIAFFNSKSNIRANIPFKLDTRGSKELLNKIDTKKTYENYKKILEKGKFFVYVIGDLNINQVKDLITSNLDNKVKNNVINYTKIFDIEKSNDVLYKEEKNNFNQSIIYFIYKLIGLNERERFVVLPLFNEILGGGSSKLFENVREKNSLAYYAYSNYISNQNILYMYAGINKDNYNKTVKVMQKQIEDIRNGLITDKELDGAKSELISSIDMLEEKESSILDYLKVKIMYDRYDYEILKEKYLSVSKEEVMKLVDKLNLDVLFFLKGEK